MKKIFYLQHIVIFLVMTVAASVGWANGTLILSLKNPAGNGTITWGRVTLQGPVNAAKDVNAGGEVEFLGLPSGKYIINANAAGFQPFSDTYELDFNIRRRIAHTLLMPPLKPVAFGKSKVKPSIITPETDQPKPVETVIPSKATVPAEEKKSDEVPELKSLPLPEIPVPKLPEMPKKKAVEEAETQDAPQSVPGEIVHKNITQEGIVDDVKSLVTRIREQEDLDISEVTLLNLGPPLMISLSYSDRNGLSAEHPVTGMVFTGIVATLALVLSGVLLTVVFLARKSMAGLFKLVCCGCSFILLLLSIASWLAFAGFGVALFDVRVKEAADEQYRIQHQLPPDREPGEDSDVIIVPAEDK